MPKNWDYAELSKLAKQTGGAEKCIEIIEKLTAEGKIGVAWGVFIKTLNAIQKELGDDGEDYDDLEKQALKEKPKLIIAGASNYPRIIDFKKFI